MKEHCIERVWDSGGWGSRHCSRKPLAGTDYCKVHTKVSADTPTFPVYRPAKYGCNIYEIDAIGETDKFWLTAINGKPSKDVKVEGDSRSRLDACRWSMEQKKAALDAAQAMYDKACTVFDNELNGEDK